MKALGAKKTRKRELALAALLAEPTVEAAAVKAGVSPVTLWRWLQEPDFHEAYRDARRKVVSQAVSHLQNAATEAVEALRRNLMAESPSVQVRAAVAILTQAFRGVELEDLAARVDALEEQGRKDAPMARRAFGT